MGADGRMGGVELQADGLGGTSGFQFFVDVWTGFQVSYVFYIVRIGFSFDADIDILLSK
jgi:hypothetical protein